MTRRQLLLLSAAPLASSAAQNLPQSLTFIGVSKFQKIVVQGLAERWSELSLLDRVSRAALAMQGTPYVGYTLEIHDHIESPSANFLGQDCWTFFEIALGLARMFSRRQSSYAPSDVLREIEWTRYRGGQCHGNYLDRIHYLEEWFRDNDRRGNVRDITRSLGPTVPLEGRRIDEMTVLWKSYRYLKNNPELRPGMAQMEAELQTHAFRYIPKEYVNAIESKLQSGDIIGIVTHKPHVYCSHVGLAIRTQDGVCRFMHASVTKKRVMIDKSVSGYLADFKSHAGIVVARPL
ncbi:MAG: N-acetylmuramoyl-L-alanine amidase-like domain-containing protein [Prosthecobacter sp.]